LRLQNILKKHPLTSFSGFIIRKVGRVFQKGKLLCVFENPGSEGGVRHVP